MPPTEASGTPASITSPSRLPAGRRDAARRHLSKATLRVTRVVPLVLLAASVVVGAERFRITDIAFDTVERLSASELLSTVGISIGSTYTQEELREQLEGAIDRLYRTGHFEEVGPFKACQLLDHEGGKRLVIPVKEKRRITVVYVKGGAPVGKDDLTKKLQTAAGRLISWADLDEDRDTILKRCHAKGFFFADVSVQATPLPGASVEVTFTVSPGPLVRIYAIHFVGNELVTDGELLDQMVTLPRDFWLLGLYRKGYFSPERLAEDVDQLRRYLRSATGLLDATIGVEQIVLDETRERMEITLRVDEGTSYTLRDFSIRTKSAVGRKPRFTVAEVLSEARAEEYIGDRYRATELDNVRQRIENMYQDAGYLNCRVQIQKPIVELEGADVTAVLEVDEKDPVYAHRIFIRGNKETQDEVIRRELDFAPGDLVTNRKIQRSKSNLYRLGYFKPDLSAVTIEPIEASATAEGTDFKVDVEEGRSGHVAFGIGLTSDLGIVGHVALRKNNFDIADWPDSVSDILDSFTGAGQTLGVELAPGTRYSQYILFFHEPYLFGRWYGLTLRGGRYFSGRDDWLEKEWRAEVKLRRYFTQNRDISIFTGYRYRIMDMSDLDGDAPRDAFEVRGKSYLSELLAGFDIDKYLFDPDAGPYRGFRIGVEYWYTGGFLGGGVDYSRAELKSAGFIPVLESQEFGHHVLTVTGSLGWMEPHGDTKEVPIYDRFLLGGPYNFRGFRTFGVGPHENGTEIGGTGRLYGTVEYSWPLLLAVPQTKFLRGVTFFDWGQLEPEFGDLRMNRMRYSAGMGIRISLRPLGWPVPVSLYWAEALEDKSGDRTRGISWIIGQFMP